MGQIFNFPDIGEGMHEGEIASWLVKVGDHVKVDDPIAEVQNDKLLQEILSPYEGEVTQLFVEAGSIVEVGSPIVAFDGATVVTDPANDEPQHKVDAIDATRSVDSSNESQSSISAPVIAGKIRAMPSVRRFARQHGLDLTQVSATGRHGNITLDDVKQLIADDSVGQSIAPSAVEQVVESNDRLATSSTSSTVQAMSPIRKAIANNMTQQKQTVPHVTLFDSVEVSQLMAHRKHFKDLAQEKAVKLTYLAYVVKAVSSLARTFPEFNSHVNMDRFETIHSEAIHIGIAVDTPNGLFVPVIKHADRRSILELAQEIERLAEAARQGTLSPDEASGSTITISNIGSAGGAWFTPVINRNESAILGLGRISPEAIINDEGELAVGNVLKLSLSFDHRLIDGVLAQKAMNYLKALLADPSYMLMEV